MTPAHVATLAALASVVTALKKSKSKDCKAILKDLEENHDRPFQIATVYEDAAALSAESGLNMVDYVRCMNAMNLERADIEAGAVPCIVEGRYAVRTEGGLKLGPKVA